MLSDEKSALEAYRKSKAKDNPRPSNPMLEFVDDPQLWSVDDERYDWLSDDTRTYLKQAFAFDYYDMMYCAGRFMTYGQMASLLMTDEKELDKYTETLWKRPSRVVYDALLMANRNIAVDDVFRKYAEAGNATAMSIMAHSVMGMDREAKGVDMRVKIVNDIEEGGE